MKLGIVLTVIGFVGTLVFLAGAADVGNWGLYTDNPWVLAAGGACFIIFVIGMYRVRKEIKKIRKAQEERERVLRGK